jgi:hypothetical protein
MSRLCNVATGIAARSPATGQTADVALLDIRGKCGELWSQNVLFWSVLIAA